MLGTIPLAVIARMTRSAMLEVLGEDYIRTARAKGLPRFRVIAIHALRNALIPVVTVIGLQVGVLFTGAILTETIFSWPGVGKWLIEGINRRDYPVLQGGTLLDRRDRHDRQSAGRCALRPDQPAHPAHPMSRRSARNARSPRRKPARRRIRCCEFWLYFSANRGAVAGLVVIVGAGSARRYRPTSSRRIRPILTNNAAFLKPPFWQAGRLASPIRSAPTRSAATSSRASSTARGCRC